MKKEKIGNKILRGMRECFEEGTDWKKSSKMKKLLRKYRRHIGYIRQEYSELKYSAFVYFN